DLRLERPAVRADVDELRAVVLARGHRDRETRSQNRLLWRADKLLSCQSGAAQNVRRQPQRHVSLTRARYRARLLEDIARHLRPHVWQEDGRIRLAAEKGEGALVERRDPVGLRIHVLDGK